MNKFEQKSTALGIELGSTRIKAVLAGPDGSVLASGAHDWENHFEGGYWTYPLEEVWAGIQDAYRNLAEDYQKTCGEPLTTVGALGVSAMMHGYLPFDKDGRQLAPFRTWRNTTTQAAAEALTKRFHFNIPQRWSVAHLYQAILNGESHVKDIAFLTTLAGYVHWQLTGEKVLGIGDASGMFPIDSQTCDYDAAMMTSFDELLAGAKLPYRLADLLPKVLCAGQDAGMLTAEGARMLDPTGTLQPGVPVCPPEGDAGTGMAATNTVAVRTGNVSAGTSIFAMVVLEKPLQNVYPEIDLVTTPDGAPVAMVHCNNCTSDLNAWVNLFGQVAALCGAKVPASQLFPLLFNASLEGAPDCGNVVPVNYYSGEGVTHFDAGHPLLLRTAASDFSLPNLMRAHIYSAMATLKIGLDILQDEKVAMDRLLGHGGLFKTPGVAQRYLAAAAQAPVTVMETAGEGGPYGMALLAGYRRAVLEGCTLDLADYLQQKIFADAPGTTLEPRAEDVRGFTAFLERYKAALHAERAAVEHF